MRFENPSTLHYEEIRHLIEGFELDNRELHPSQFLTGVAGNELLGFGRIREHKTCSELCSLGVTEPNRHNGIGKKLVINLTAKALQPLYLVCIIPAFFEPLGFSITGSYPPEIADKLEYCRSALMVPEEYVVMHYEKQYRTHY